LQHLAARIFTKEQTGIAESRCFTKTFVGDPSRSETANVAKYLLWQTGLNPSIEKQKALCGFGKSGGVPCADHLT
jgi:hypothetical protein